MQMDGDISASTAGRFSVYENIPLLSKLNHISKYPHTVIFSWPSATQPVQFTLKQTAPMLHLQICVTL